MARGRRPRVGGRFPSPARLEVTIEASVCNRKWSGFSGVGMMADSPCRSGSRKRDGVAATARIACETLKWPMVYAEDTCSGC